MKKQIVLAVTVASLLFVACDNEIPVKPAVPPDIMLRPSPPLINSVYPATGTQGSILTILGENFGPAILDNRVAFGSAIAEITYIGYGILNVRVPDLPDGDYEIYVNVAGQVRRAPQMFTIVGSEHR
ncbi:MAG TPA: IPT/TIG domain-containing protein [Chryseolinea sp.]